MTFHARAGVSFGLGIVALLVMGQIGGDILPSLIVGVIIGACTWVLLRPRKA